MQATEIIDLRSDTVTKPTAPMRRAMAEAEVGDAVVDVDPTMDRLEKLTAELLGKEDAIFVPSGSMANQVALRTHCGRGGEFLCEADCHLYCYEQAAFASLSGLVPRLIPTDGGTIECRQLQAISLVEDDHFPRPQLLCLENTHNRWGGRVLDQDEVVADCRWASSNGLATHLDGARLWNAAEASGRALDELAEPFDSVSVCFSKGLGAPVGSALAGSRDFIREARRARKLFGGAMRQVGIVAAGALYAVQHHRERLSQDHENAQVLRETIESIEGFQIRGGRVETNMVTFEIENGGEPKKVSEPKKAREPKEGRAGEFVGLLRDRGVSCFDIADNMVRLVTHLDVSQDSVQRACNIIREAADELQSAMEIGKSAPSKLAPSELSNSEPFNSGRSV